MSTPDERLERLVRETHAEIGSGVEEIAFLSYVVAVIGRELVAQLADVAKAIREARGDG